MQTQTDLCSVVRSLYSEFFKGFTNEVEVIGISGEEFRRKMLGMKTMDCVREEVPIAT